MSEFYIIFNSWQRSFSIVSLFSFNNLLCLFNNLFNSFEDRFIHLLINSSFKYFFKCFSNRFIINCIRICRIRICIRNITFMSNKRISLNFRLSINFINGNFSLRILSLLFFKRIFFLSLLWLFSLAKVLIILKNNCILIKYLRHEPRRCRIYTINQIILTLKQSFLKQHYFRFILLYNLR